MRHEGGEHLPLPSPMHEYAACGTEWLKHQWPSKAPQEKALETPLSSRVGCLLHSIATWPLGAHYCAHWHPAGSEDSESVNESTLMQCLTIVGKQANAAPACTFSRLPRERPQDAGASTVDRPPQTVARSAIEPSSLGQTGVALALEMRGTRVSVSAAAVWLLLGLAGATEITGGISNVGGVQLQEEEYVAQARARGTRAAARPSQKFFSNQRPRACRTKLGRQPWRAAVLRRCELESCLGLHTSISYAP